MKTAFMVIHVENCRAYKVSMAQYEKQLKENEDLKKFDLTIEFDTHTKASCLSIFDETGSHLTGIICSGGKDLSEDDQYLISITAQKIFQNLRPKGDNSTKN